MKTLRNIAILLVTMSINAHLMAQDSGNPPPPANNNSYYNTDGAGLTKGDNVISAGLGLGGLYSYGINGSGWRYGPNFILSYDNGTFDNIGPGVISLGGLLSYKGISYGYTSPDYPYYSYNETWSYWLLGFRGAYHLDVKSYHFDPYAGLMLGYYFTSYNFSSNDPYYRNPGDMFYYEYNQSYNSYVGISAFLGLRYNITRRFGLWVELDYGYTNFAYGVSVKF